MNFAQFLQEQSLQEAPLGHHSSVESILRGLKLEHKGERVDTGRVFTLDKDYIITSFNNGKVVLSKKGVSKPIASVQEFDDSKLVKSVIDMIQKNAPDLFDKERKEFKSGMVV